MIQAQDIPDVQEPRQAVLSTATAEHPHPRKEIVQSVSLTASFFIGPRAGRCFPALRARRSKVATR